MKTILVDVDDCIVKSVFVDVAKMFSEKPIKLGNEYYMNELVPESRVNDFYNYLIENDVYKNYKVFDDAKSILKKLSKSFDIYICSACVLNNYKERSGSLFKSKFDFLINNLPFISPDNYIFANNKSLIVADIQIDDRLENLVSNKYTKIKLLYTAYHNKNLSKEELDKHHVIRVNNWNEIADYLLK